MEEGGYGCSEVETLRRRFRLWQERGKKELEIAPEVYRQLNYSTRWFGTYPTLQHTWGQLIRVLLFAEGQPPDGKQILHVQANQWGRPESKAAILEMFALPCRNTSEFPYPDMSDAWFLRSRNLYRHYFYRSRAERLWEMIQEVQDRNRQCSRVLVFYGAGFEHFWEGVVRKRFDKVAGIDRLKETSVGSVRCFQMLHPAARQGAGDAYFEKVGKYVSRYIN
jgi:hypothetical protein